MVAALDTTVIAANTTVSAPDTMVSAAKCIDIRLGILNKTTQRLNKDLQSQDPGC
jgi:hypothetical protein